MYSPVKKHRTVKRFGPYACAHRNHFTNSHCQHVHGYAITVTVEFASDHLSRAGFVEDFGDMGDIKQALTAWFDHTLLIAESDPLLAKFTELQELGGCNLTIMPHTVSMEHRAQMVLDWLHENNYKTALSVEVREHENNAGSVTS